jgi:transcription elongation factor Elf1
VSALIQLLKIQLRCPRCRAVAIEVQFVRNGEDAAEEISRVKCGGCGDFMSVDLPGIRRGVEENVWFAGPVSPSVTPDASGSWGPGAGGKS